ncbi:MAG: phytoene desaturase [Candidatus Kapaibacteriales bacterium]
MQASPKKVKPTVNIIGSGFGGLSLAVRLQSKGYQVTIFEKNDMPGGHAYQIKEKGYTFDMGPSLITAPKILEDLFASAGKKVEDYLDLHYLDPFYRIYYADKTYIDYSGDAESMKKQMAEFNKEDAKKYDDFIDFSEQIYHAVITDGLGARPFSEISTMIKFIPRALKTKALYPAYMLASRFFKDPRHRFMFSFHPLFIGGNPFRVPSIYLMISYLEKEGGVWYSTGGMYSLVEALKNIFEEKGGRIITNAEVTGLDIKDGKAIALYSNGRYYLSDITVSNADITHTYQNLIAPEHRKKWTDQKLDSAKYSMGCFVLYLGVKKKYPELKHHTLILSPRYKELVKDIFDNHVLPEDFSMYLHVPSKTDPSMAPEGCESIYILAPVTNMKANIDWDITGPLFAEKMIQYLEHEFGMEDLEEHIDYKSWFTPKDFKEKRNSHLGSPWGLEPSLLQTAYFRPHNNSSDIEGLYFVGAGTHPGAGVPGVMLSAEATEKCIDSDIEKVVGKTPEPELESA